MQTFQTLQTLTWYVKQSQHEALCLDQKKSFIYRKFTLKLVKVMCPWERERERERERESQIDSYLIFGMSRTLVVISAASGAIFSTLSSTDQNSFFRDSIPFLAEKKKKFSWKAGECFAVLHLLKMHTDTHRHRHTYTHNTHKHTHTHTIIHIHKHTHTHILL